METLVRFFSLFLEILFFVGMAGSAIVVLMTTIEDAEVFMKEADQTALPGTASENGKKQGSP